MSATLLDRYLARRLTTPFAAGIVIVVLLFTLENSTRLLKLLENVKEPVLTFLRMSSCLIPEYVALGSIVATFLAISVALRSLAQSNELDIIGAIGLSPRRMLRVPLLFAIAAAALFLGLRMVAQPWGEGRLEKLQSALHRGDLGIGIEAGRFLDLGQGYTLHVDHIQHENGRMTGVFVASPEDTIVADSATAINAGAEGLMVRLENGNIIRQTASGRLTHVSFDHLKMPISRLAPKETPPTLRHLNDSSYPFALVTRAFTAPAHEVRLSALSALMARAADAGLILLTPFLAFSLAIPARRTTSAIGLAAGVIVVAVALHMINMFEELASLAGIAAIAGVLAGYTAITLAAWAYTLNNGQGSVDALLSRAISPIARRIARFVARRRAHAARRSDNAWPMLNKPAEAQ